jgi:hypothetical protein
MVFFMCTRADAGEEEQMNFDALKVSIHRILKMQNKRDIIVAVCQHTPIISILILVINNFIPKSMLGKIINFTL